MKYQSFTAAVLAALLLLTLASCGKAQAPDKGGLSVPAVSQEGEMAEEPKAPGGENTPEEPETPAGESAPVDADAPAEDEAWKTEFEESLLENYGVTPDHYEDLGGGVYQVYVEIGGKVVPYVAVDSATGDYHG